MIDLSTQFGQRVAKRLEEESIIWLITVSQDGFPQPRPVWFWWNGESFLIFSRPEGAKLRHIQRNPREPCTWTAIATVATLLSCLAPLRSSPPVSPPTISRLFWLNMRAGSLRWA